MSSVGVGSAAASSAVTSGSVVAWSAGGSGWAWRCRGVGRLLGLRLGRPGLRVLLHLAPEFLVALAFSRVELLHVIELSLALIVLRLLLLELLIDLPLGDRGAATHPP